MYSWEVDIKAQFTSTLIGTLSSLKTIFYVEKWFSLSDATFLLFLISRVPTDILSFAFNRILISDMKIMKCIDPLETSKTDTWFIAEKSINLVVAEN